MIQSTPPTIASRSPRSLTGLTRPLLPALVLVCLAGPSALRAQDDKLPKAEVILDRYVEVTGGQAAYAKLNNRVTKATLEFVGQGLKFSVTVYAARPNRMYTLMESEAFGKIEKGTDGQVVWETNPIMGPQIKEGEERALMLRTATFDGVVHWRKLYKEAECVGVETIDGKPCYKIVLTPHEGSPETRYYDKKSNLVVKTEMTLKRPMGPIPVQVFASDYKRVDGILLPHGGRVLVLGQQRLVTTESIRHNVKLPKDRFKLPEDIQMLVDKQKSKNAKAKDPKESARPKPRKP